MTAEVETQGRKKQFLECATSPVLVRPCWGSLRKINTRNSLSSSFSFLFPRFSLFYEINTANLAVNQTNHTGACPNVRTAPKTGGERVGASPHHPLSHPGPHLPQGARTAATPAAPPCCRRHDPQAAARLSPSRALPRRSPPPRYPPCCCCCSSWISRNLLTTKDRRISSIFVAMTPPLPSCPDARPPASHSALRPRARADVPAASPLPIGCVRCKPSRHWPRRRVAANGRSSAAHGP